MKFDPETLKRIAFSGFGFAMSPTQRAMVAMAAKHQEDIVRVMCVLPGRYRYAQVAAAINASGVLPMDIYHSLCANQHTIALARFYEALNGTAMDA